MKGKKLARWGLCLAGVLSAGSALAGEPELGELEGMLNEEIVTTASKTAQTTSSAPAVSVTMSAEELRRHGINTIAQAIEFLSLGGITSESGDVGARGLIMADDRGNHVLLLVNGHAVNETLFGSARFDRGAGIPIEMVDHIEVILGPGSVLYGSNAMFGVINVVTKSAETHAGTHLLVESEIGKSWRAGASGGYDFDFLGRRADLTLGVEYFRQDGPEFTLPRQSIGISDPVTGEPWRFGRKGPHGAWGGPNQGEYSEVPSGLLRLSWHDFELSVQGLVNHKSWPLGFPRRQEIASDYDERDNYEIERRLWADLKRRWRLSQHAELVTRVYADSYEYNRYANVSTTYYCQYEGVATCRNTTLGLSRWLGAEAQTSLDWFNDSSLVTLIGLDGRIRYAGYKVDHEDYDTGVALESSSSVLRETDTVLGVYLQQTWQPGEIFGLNAGTRVDAYSDFGSRVSPRLAGTARVWPGAMLKAVYSEAFRAPNWYEAKSTGGLRIEARELDPETVRSVELSIEQKLRTHRLLWGVFRSWWYDMIQLQTLSPDELSDAQRRGEAPFGVSYATQFRNVAHIDNYGYNAGYEGSAIRGRLTFGANVTGAYSRQERRGLPEASVPLAPRLSGNARVAYALPDLWPTLAVAGQYVASRPSDVALDTDSANPPYADPQFQLRGTISGEVPYVSGLKYRATANYAFSDDGGYVVGLVDATTPPLFSPVDTFRVTAGLQFDF